MLGVVPKSEPMEQRLRYVLCSDDGTYYASEPMEFGESAQYGSGDTVTVRIDFEAGTLDFAKNGNPVGSPQKIPTQEAYCFCVEAYSYDDGDSATVTIEELV